MSLRFFAHPIQESPLYIVRMVEWINFRSVDCIKSFIHFLTRILETCLWALRLWDNTCGHYISCLPSLTFYIKIVLLFCLILNLEKVYNFAIYLVLGWLFLLSNCVCLMHNHDVSNLSIFSYKVDLFEISRYD